VKRHIADLALFGGPAEFMRPLVVGRPNIGDRERFLDRVGWALDNQWLTNNGPLVREFENRVAAIAGVRNCVATCNATIALQILIRALDLSGEIIVPSMTYVATPHAASWLGLEPVFCDIDPRTACLDPAQVKAAITTRTTGIIGVHLWGRPCAIDALSTMAEDNDVALLFDSAHAVGCTFGGRPIGGFGAAEVFSFHATKVANALEGGAIVTDDDELADRARAMCNFGLGELPGMVGTNGKMSEVAAAMGLTSLDGFETAVACNKSNYELYRSEFADLAGVDVIRYDSRERNNYHYVIIELDAAATGLHRDLLLDVLRAENVTGRAYFSPGCHQIRPYSARPVELPHTERLADRVLALPTGTSVSHEDVRRVCDVVRLAVREGHEVTERRRRQAG
jgi:dTDP-4-amino-4,6-dideoxyglucose